MKIRVLTLALLISIVTGLSATAFEAPLLTWERGRTQQVVLGGGDYTSNWRVQLEGEGLSPLQFRRSNPNAAGYVVYSIELPSNLALGSYSVATYGEGSPRTVVAGVIVIAEESNSATTSLLDLTAIIAIFLFLTGFISTLRSPKYSHFRFLQLPHSYPAQSGLRARLINMPIAIRYRFLHEVNTSLVKSIVVDQSEVLRRRSQSFANYLPFTGILIGSIGAIEMITSEGLIVINVGVIALLIALAAVDIFSAAVAVVTFWAASLVTGDVASVRDFVFILTVGFGAIGPVLLAKMSKLAIEIDSNKLSALPEKMKAIFSVIVSSIFGAAVFLLSLLLLQSVTYEETQLTTVTWQSVSIIFAILIGMGLISDIDRSKAISESESISFQVARVSSPKTAIFVNLLIFSFVYIWTTSFERALLVSSLFAIPYYLVFLNFESSSKFLRLKVGRSVLLEPIIVAATSWLIFMQISNQPLLQSESSYWMLVLTAVVPIIHALISATLSYSQREEILAT